MPCSRAQILDEALGRFELRARGGRSERLDARGLEAVGEARGQRRFRAADREIDSLLLGEGDEAIEVHRIDGHAFGDLRDAGISRRAIELRHQRACGNRPGKRVLASARTDEEDVHAWLSCWSRRVCAVSSRAWRMKPRPHRAPKAIFPSTRVSELANRLKRAVEDAFPYVRVRGEISGLKFNSSGHVYFDLKDDKAVLNAVMWRTTAQRLKLARSRGSKSSAPGGFRPIRRRRATSSSSTAWSSPASAR